MWKHSTFAQAAKLPFLSTRFYRQIWNFTQLCCAKLNRLRGLTTCNWFSEKSYGHESCKKNRVKKQIAKYSRWSRKLSFLVRSQRHYDKARCSSSRSRLQQYIFRGTGSLTEPVLISFSPYTMLNMIWMRSRSFTAIEQRTVFYYRKRFAIICRVSRVIWNSSENLWNVWECLHEDVLRYLTLISCCTTFIISNSICAEDMQLEPTRPRWVYQELDPRVSPVTPTEDPQLRFPTGRSIHLRIRHV